ncbi:CoA-transferase [Mammaliicoccus stepanovicii]|uniref:Acetyl-CoA transferase n=1 Tax=Mammaliicoccus stepanovicii TaxID=643214 RepID=A0A239YB71_9STAP|nr:malonate decarboxylase subunit alpha [Mammaliicoccus stepanovicii]PNZ75480.1 acyl CoA:acetate/3-ketoacid CoA transferase [Mammaliicoccus stepanovicii]GGI43093.1 acyl CoA:acetate/3-ketoacid CoA transferase [Mammaliicoccus stepanovicii]SNV55952.1 acetyl-CoA transferase [Mammaliicoccus stepanovicii]
MEIISFKDIKDIIKRGDVIGLAALSASNLPVNVLKHIVEAHDEYGNLDNLTLMVANDISDYRGDGYDLDSFISRKMIKQLVLSIIIGSPKTIEAMKDGDVEAYFVPQGILTTHYREESNKFPNKITKIGLHTNVDPRYNGGKVNKNTKTDIVSLLEIDGEEYLQYKFPKVDVALLRGTYADTKGNIYMNHEAHLGEGYGVALAAHANGGKVIVQVKQIVQEGSFKPTDVFIPSELVDYVVVNDNPKLHRQSMQSYYDPAISGEYRVNGMQEEFNALSTKKVILRRSAQFLNKGHVVSIGFGISNDLSNLLVEEKADNLVQLNIDIGNFGGMIGSGKNYGMNYNVDAKLRHEMTWDFIYNGGLDVAYLSFAEIDQYGNVNVSKYGDRMNGCGGFIDISQTVKKIVFSGTMVVGSKTICADEHLIIEQEGHTKKFVEDVHNLDFNAKYSRELGQEVYYVTERAVFKLVDEGVKLIEIAPGLDLEKDILAHIAFKPIIADNLKVMSNKIYQQDWGELKQIIQDNGSNY